MSDWSVIVIAEYYGGPRDGERVYLDGLSNIASQYLPEHHGCYHYQRCDGIPAFLWFPA